MRNKINEIRALKKMTLKSISEKATITEQTLIRVIKGYKAKETTLIKIANALGEKIENVFMF